MQGEEGVFGVERFSSAALCVKREKRRERLCHAGRHHTHGLAARNLAEHAQNVPNGIVAIGEDIAFSRSAVFRRGDTAVSAVADVHEIIAARNTGGHLSAHIIFDQLNEMICPAEIGSDDARRVHDDRGQTFLCRVEHKLCGDCLGLCVRALHEVGGEGRHLGDDAVFGKFGNGVHRADIDELGDGAPSACVEHVARAFDVDLFHERRTLAGDIYDARRVNDHGGAVLGDLKKFFKIFGFRDVAFRNFYTERAEIGCVFSGQDERPHVVLPRAQGGADSASQVPVGTGNEINFFHAGSSFSVILF